MLDWKPWEYGAASLIATVDGWMYLAHDDGRYGRARLDTLTGWGAGAVSGFGAAPELKNIDYAKRKCEELEEERLGLRPAAIV